MVVPYCRHNRNNKCNRERHCEDGRLCQHNLDNMADRLVLEKAQKLQQQYFKSLSYIFGLDVNDVKDVDIGTQMTRIMEQKAQCTHCNQFYPETEEHFPLLDHRLDLLDELGIDDYQCKRCIRHKVARLKDLTPIYKEVIMKILLPITAIASFFGVLFTNGELKLFLFLLLSVHVGIAGLLAYYERQQETNKEVTQ